MRELKAISQFVATLSLKSTFLTQQIELRSKCPTNIGTGERGTMEGILSFCWAKIREADSLG